MQTKKKSMLSAEFRQECVALVLTQHYSVMDAAKAMNIGKSSLAKWVKQAKSHQVTVPITAEQQRIKELEKKLKRLEMENSILKKATALLMSDSLHHVS